MTNPEEPPSNIIKFPAKPRTDRVIETRDVLDRYQQLSLRFGSIEILDPIKKISRELARLVGVRSTIFKEFGGSIDLGKFGRYRSAIGELGPRGIADEETVFTETLTESEKKNFPLMLPLYNEWDGYVAKINLLRSSLTEAWNAISADAATAPDFPDEKHREIQDYFDVIEILDVKPNLNEWEDILERVDEFIVKAPNPHQ